MGFEIIFVALTVVFTVLAVTVPVIAWATFHGLQQRRLIDELRAMGLSDVASKGDEDAERPVSVVMRVHGRLLEVEAVERGAVALWHIRAPAEREEQADLFYAREGWRPVPALRSAFAEAEAGAGPRQARFEAEDGVYSAARVDGAWLVELLRDGSGAAALYGAATTALSIMDPGRALPARSPPRPLSGAPVALPS